jgi:transposase
LELSLIAEADITPSFSLSAHSITPYAKEGHEREGKKWNYYEYKKLFPELKEQFPFLKEACSQSLQEAVKWLDRAFKNLFKGLAKFSKFESIALHKFSSYSPTS